MDLDPFRTCNHKTNHNNQTNKVLGKITMESYQYVPIDKGLTSILNIGYAGISLVSFGKIFVEFINKIGDFFKSSGHAFYAKAI